MDENAALDLDAVQQRIVGSLLEKERTTPAEFPLTLNALERACNQQTSRDPVTSYSGSVLTASLEQLKALGLVRFVYSQSNRATKYRTVLDEVLDLDDPDVSMVGLLLLRGPQTVAELRTRAQRWCEPSTQDVAESLQRLAGRGLARDLGRQPGQKETRWTHLLGEVAVQGHVEFAPAVEIGADAGVGRAGSGAPDRIVELELRVAELESLVGMLMDELGLSQP